MSTKNLMQALIAFCNRKEPFLSCKMQHGIVLKVRVEIKRSLFGSDIQTLELSE
jgi:hypothetical protein